METRSKKLITSIVLLGILTLAYWIVDNIDELAIFEQQSKSLGPCAPSVTSDVPWDDVLSTPGPFCRIVPTNAEISGNLRISILVQVVNADPDAEYSVIIESTQRYVSSGTLIQRSRIKNRIAGHRWKILLLDYCLALYGPGQYSITVHEVKGDHPNNMLQEEVTGSPMGLNTNRMDQPTTPTVRPPCQSLPYDGLTNWKGKWVGPRVGQDKPFLEMMRTGWLFLPENCDLEIFSKTDILAARKSNRPVSIVILGNSVHRGIFLSLVDLALSRREKAVDFDQTQIHTCWGRMSVQVGNLKFTYQDLRTELMRGDDSATTCHNERVASFPGLFSNATNMIKNLFLSKTGDDWPSVILLNSACFAGELRNVKLPFQALDMVCIDMVKEWLSVVPREWNGTIYVADAIFSALARTLDRHENMLYSESLVKMNALLDDPRARMIHGEGLSTAMRLWAEHPGNIMKSQHFHRPCHGLDGNSDVGICSNVTEAIAHLLLGRALAPRGKSRWEKPTPKRKPPEDFHTPRVCLDCPAGLLPFHVKAEPSLDCSTGSLDEIFSKRPVVYSYGDFFPCPSHCLATDPISNFPTQSGSVDVRECYVP